MSNARARALDSYDYPSADPAPVSARGAEIHLNDWILAFPATRSVWVIDRMLGKWRVGLAINSDLGQCERLPAAQHADYAQCVINAIEIAKLAGYA